MVLEEHETAVVLPAEALAKLSRRVEFLLEPEGEPHEEELEPRGRVRDVGLEQALELQERLVVEDDQVEVAFPDACFLEAVVDRVLREAIVVLLPRETLFLRGSDDFAIAHQCGGAVVIIRGDPEDIHGPNRGGP